MATKKKAKPPAAKIQTPGKTISIHEAIEAELFQARSAKGNAYVMMRVGPNFLSIGKTTTLRVKTQAEIDEQGFTFVDYLTDEDSITVHGSRDAEAEKIAKAAEPLVGLPELSSPQALEEIPDCIPYTFRHGMYHYRAINAVDKRGRRRIIMAYMGYQRRDEGSYVPNVLDFPMRENGYDTAGLKVGRADRIFIGYRPMEELAEFRNHAKAKEFPPNFGL